MSKLHLVFGGRVKDPRALDFDLNTIDLVGIYDSYAAAEDAWRGAAQRTVDDAEMKYVVVHLHRLLEPDLEGTIAGIARPNSRGLGLPVPPQQQRSLEQQTGGEAADVRRGRKQVALPAREPAHHQLQHDPGDQQPDDVDPAVDPQVVGERLGPPEAERERARSPR